MIGILIFQTDSRITRLTWNHKNASDSTHSVQLKLTIILNCYFHCKNNMPHKNHWQLKNNYSVGVFEPVHRNEPFIRTDSLKRIGHPKIFMNGEEERRSACSSPLWPAGGVSSFIFHCCFSGASDLHSHSHSLAS